MKLIVCLVLMLFARVCAGVVFTGEGGCPEGMIAATTQGGPIMAEFVMPYGFPMRSSGWNSGVEGADDAEFITSCVPFSMDGLPGCSVEVFGPAGDDSLVQGERHAREWEITRLSSLGFLSQRSDENAGRITALVNRLASESSAKWFGLMGGLLLVARWRYRR